MKVFVVGRGISYANWIPDLQLVSTIHDAELVLFTGGEDISPSIYGHRNVGSYFNVRRDHEEVNAYFAALKIKKPMYGTCRGLQLLCAMNGGRLFQDMSHPMRHEIITKENDVIITNSLHHQLCDPYNLHPSQYEILAFADSLSDELISAERNYTRADHIKEPEIVFFPKTKCLGIQGHPEMMDINSGLVKYARKCLEKLF